MMSALGTARMKLGLHVNNCTTCTRAARFGGQWKQCPTGRKLADAVNRAAR